MKHESRQLFDKENLSVSTMWDSYHSNISRHQPSYFAHLLNLKTILWNSYFFRQCITHFIQFPFHFSFSIPANTNFSKHASTPPEFHRTSPFDTSTKIVAKIKGRREWKMIIFLHIEIIAKYLKLNMLFS